MTQKLTPGTVLILAIPPLLWAGNAVVGRATNDLVPPITLNFMRWVLAFIILLPLGWSVFRPGSGLWRQRSRYAVLGLLGVGTYNGMQYLALQTSTPVNITLVGASMPVWMLLVGHLFFRTQVAGRQVAGAALSLCGVVLVLSQGNVMNLQQFNFVVGDLYMLVATLAWSFYSWFLSRAGGAGGEGVRRDWATFLMAQMAFGLLWSGSFAGLEWTVTDASITWGWPLLFTLLYVAIGPSILAYRCWGAGVQRVGPATAGFFTNLTPLFAAILSSIFLGEVPRFYHGVAFMLIVAGIVLSSRRAAG